MINSRRNYNHVAWNHFNTDPPIIGALRIPSVNFGIQIKIRLWHSNLLAFDLLAHIEISLSLQHEAYFFIGVQMFLEKIL